MRFRPHNWSLAMAGKAIAISLVAIGAGFVLQAKALPKLVETLREMDREPSAWIALGLQFSSLLPLLPVPGLVLGIGAIIMPTFRKPLAALAIVAAAAATAVIVAMLIGTMAPLYEIPRELPM